MLEWGAVSLEKSVNQPSLPHAIIAVNATDISVPEKEWDAAEATRNLLKSVRNALSATEGVPMFRKLAHQWRAMGRPIKHIEDLIYCYYASFTVVRIPEKGRYGLLQKQVEALHRTIVSRCDESRETKQQANMLAHSDQLGNYIQLAFDHFSSKLDEPFNFIQVALKKNPIPHDFSEHILQLALAIAERNEGQEGVWIFTSLSKMVASCVLLESRDRPGRPCVAIQRC